MYETNSRKLRIAEGAQLCLCDDLEEWDGVSGREDDKEKIYVNIWMIHVVVQQKLTQCCQAIILQFKNKNCEKKKKNTVKALYNSVRFHSVNILSTIEPCT